MTENAITAPVNWRVCLPLGHVTIRNSRKLFRKYLGKIIRPISRIGFRNGFQMRILAIRAVPLPASRKGEDNRFANDLSLLGLPDWADVRSARSRIVTAWRNRRFFCLVDSSATTTPTK